MGKKENEWERTLTAEAAERFFLRIADGIRAGRLVLGDGTDAVPVSPAPPIVVKVSVRRKKDKEKLGIKLSWTAPSPKAGDAAEQTRTDTFEKTLSEVLNEDNFG